MTSARASEKKKKKRYDRGWLRFREIGNTRIFFYSCQLRFGGETYFAPPFNPPNPVSSSPSFSQSYLLEYYIESLKLRSSRQEKCYHKTGARDHGYWILVHTCEPPKRNEYVIAQIGIFLYLRDKLRHPQTDEMDFIKNTKMGRNKRPN